MAQSVRQHAHRAVRAPNDRLCAADPGGASRHRRHAVAGRQAVIGGAWSLVAAIILQAVLGILTLLHQVPIDLALAHQATAIVVLTLAVLQTERLVARSAGTTRRNWLCRSDSPAEIERF